MFLGQWDVRLLTASYRKVENEQLAIEMFGKTMDGESITIRYVGFEPYFFIIEPTKQIVEELGKDKDVRRVEETELFHKGSMNKALKIVVMYPWLVPDFRSKLKKNFEVLAADIPFHHRFIYDLDIGSCLRVIGERTEGKYTTDLVVNMTSFEDIPPFNPDLKILSFDIESSVKDNTILTICYVIREKGELKHGKYLFGPEKEIIQAFGKVVEEEDPDVITGYNIDNFDIPAIVERGKLLGIKNLEWGRDHSDPRRIGVRGWRLTGRLIADAWWCAKMQLKPKQETLNHVAKRVLGEQKLDVDPSKLDDEWAADKDTVMRYCSKDAELALKILENVGTLRRTMDLASVSKLPVDDVLSSGTSMLIDSILIRAADRAHVGVPLTGGFEDEEETYEGGYVHTIDPGLYHWVCVLDFKSMYPSLIIAKNICFTTMNPLGDVVSPTGVHFLSKEQREGLLPHILKDLMKERDDIKKRMKKAETPDEYRYYDGLQNAVKILMNAVYGVFGTTFYRFTDRNISSSITAFARETTQTVIRKLEEEGFKVIYGDSITAGRFVTVLSPEGTVQIKNIEELFNENNERITKSGEKEVIRLVGYKALSMLPSGRSTWSEIKEIIRHKTDKRIYRVGQKYGESVTTEDHSFLTWQDNHLVETKPIDMLGNSMVRVEEIPPVKKVETLDMYELLKHYSYETTYKGSIKKSGLRKDDKYIWFNWTVRKNPVKLKRFIETDTPEFEALCRILGAYIAEGSSSTIETTARKGASISTSDKAWLEQLQKDYYLLFSGTTASVIRSTRGTRELTYNNSRGEVTVLYDDHTYKLQMMNQMAAVLFKVLCGQKSGGKRLPDFIFHVEDRYKRVMLEEMIKGDGSRLTNKNLPCSDEYKKAFFRYETKSLQLACGISLLLNQLNEKYSIRYGENKSTYCITRTHDHYNNMLRSKIKEEKYDGYVYDLSVEDTHAFVDSCGQILLHNTDSLFVQSPESNLEGTVEFGNKLADRFSKEVSQMEFQKVLNPLFSHGKKKRYVGRSVWPNEELLIRGYEIRRTDSFDLQSEVLMEVFELVLDEKPEEAVKYARSQVDELLECKVPAEKLVISRTCKSFNSYKDPDSQVNVQAARKLMALGYEFVPGMKVSWVVTNGKKRPQEVQPYVSGRKFEGQPDCRYYAERLAQSVARATEVFGWGEKDLMTGSQQFTLFDNAFGVSNVKEKKKKEANVKKSDKKMSLQDFM